MSRTYPRESLPQKNKILPSRQARRERRSKLGLRAQVRRKKKKKKKRMKMMMKE
jgi:hypothetical protein